VLLTTRSLPAQHDNEIAVVTAARTARDRAVEDFHNEPEGMPLSSVSHNRESTQALMTA